MSLGRKSGIQANGNISVNRSKNGVTIERKDKRISITLKNVALENLLKRQTDRERTNFTDSLEKSRAVMIAILSLLIYLKINGSVTVVSLHTHHKPNTRV